MALSAPHRVVLVQHRIDAVCDLVRKVIIVLDVAAVDVNRQPAHVDGLGVANCTAASCSCLCQLTGVDFWNREPGKHTAHGVRQAPHRVHHNLAALLDALCHEFHEVGHILVSMRKRSFLRNGETEGAINRRGQIACNVLHAPGVVIDTGCQHFRDLILHLGQRRGDGRLDGRPARGRVGDDGCVRIGDGVFDHRHGCGHRCADCCYAYVLI